MDRQEFNKARKIAVEYGQEYVEYVEDRYKEFLKREGNAEQVIY